MAKTGMIDDQKLKNQIKHLTHPKSDPEEEQQKLYSRHAENNRQKSEPEFRGKNRQEEKRGKSDEGKEKEAALSCVEDARWESARNLK